MVALIVATAVSGCTGLFGTADAGSPSPPVTPRSDASAAPGPTGSAGPSEASGVRAEPDPGNPPVDSGAREHATGVVTTDATGTPVRYEVASDDNAGAICNRLGVRWWQLEAEDGELLGTYPMLYVGDPIIITTKSEPEGPANNALC